jgi:hypothetical protein
MAALTVPGPAGSAGDEAEGSRGMLLVDTIAAPALAAPRGYPSAAGQ